MQTDILRRTRVVQAVVFLGKSALGHVVGGLCRCHLGVLPPILSIEEERTAVFRRSAHTIVRARPAGIKNPTNATFLAIRAVYKVLPVSRVVRELIDLFVAVDRHNDVVSFRDWYPLAAFTKPLAVGQIAGYENRISLQPVYERRPLLGAFCLFFPPLIKVPHLGERRTRRARLRLDTRGCLDSVIVVFPLLKADLFTSRRYEHQLPVDTGAGWPRQAHIVEVDSGRVFPW